MAKYSVKLKSDGQFYQVDAGAHKLKIGDNILVESDQCTELGFIIPSEISLENESGDETGTKKDNLGELIFIRKLSDADREKITALSKEAKSYIVECQDKIDKFKLPMVLLDADLSYDEKKLTFYFSAPSRVDFRMLVSDLAHTFKKIIRLQQVGARDEARHIGGVGRCGQQLCCKRFLKGNLESVTLDMAYEQSLAQMGSNRVTGNCGKLMCCLKYELPEYKKIKAKMPAIGDELKTSKGKGKVISQNIFKNCVSVKLDEDGGIVEVSC
ncbi:MAG: regulatory iron-sulfur-containing complex subunit RicT [Patescibacteria group bacterium]